MRSVFLNLKSLKKAYVHQLHIFLSKYSGSSLYFIKNRSYVLQYVGLLVPNNFDLQNYTEITLQSM